MLNYSLIEEFLGVKANAEMDVINPKETTFFDYKGKMSNYQIVLIHDCNQVAVSGSTGLPFGADSIFEFYIYCDVIINKRMHLDASYGLHLGSNGLYFWKNDFSKIDNLALQIHIRKDGDLCVWPNKLS